jgi:predicted nucleic acid-binding protein
MRDWIINASPLILLGKINRLDLLSQLSSSLLIPRSVSLEILAGPDGDPAKSWLELPSAAQCIAEDAPVSLEVLAWDLGAGETAVISMAMQSGNSVCVLDDLAARNCAKVFDIPVIGTLGILLKAKIAGLIPTLRPEIDNLVACGSMLSPRIIAEALELANESA